MKTILYRKTYDEEGSINDFLNLYYSVQMKYLASDLLQKGISIDAIENAINRAIVSAEKNNILIRANFLPVFSAIGGVVARDCKLSKLGYALVLLNINPEHKFAANWQLELLNLYLGKATG